jgi:hypothetical protein
MQDDLCRLLWPKQSALFQLTVDKGKIALAVQKSWTGTVRSTSCVSKTSCAGAVSTLRASKFPAAVLLHQSLICQLVAVLPVETSFTNTVAVNYFYPY